MQNTLRLLIVFVVGYMPCAAQFSSTNYAFPQDSLALVDLYNSTNGQNWINKSGWLVSNVRGNWFGINNGLNYCYSSSYNCPEYFNVSSIHLPQNNLYGTIPSALGNIPASRINLSYNMLFDSIPSSLSNSALESLNLSFNGLSGNLPATLMASRTIDSLDLSHNQLTGNIPEAVEQMEEIRHLNLSFNGLNGPVPAAVARLAQNAQPITSLDLSYNKFTFDGMELLAQQVPFAIYAPQDVLPIFYSNCNLSVNAGGTLANNTYRWFKDDVLVATITGDSTFAPRLEGSYRVEVSNAVANALTLQSTAYFFKTVIWTGAAGSAWEDPANWRCGILPDSLSVVQIDSGSTVVLHSADSCRKIIVNDGGNFTIAGGGNLTVFDSFVLRPGSTFSIADGGHFRLSETRSGTIKFKVVDGRSWHDGDTVLANAPLTTITLYRSLQDVAANLPAYTFVSNDSGYAIAKIDAGSRYYFKAKKGNFLNIHRNCVVKDIFFSYQQILGSPYQYINAPTFPGGPQYYDINDDGVIDSRDYKIADEVTPVVNSIVEKKVVIY